MAGLGTSQALLYEKLTLRQEGLLSVALQELVRAGTVHAIWVAKCGCWLHFLHSHLILLGVNLALMLWAYILSGVGA